MDISIETGLNVLNRRFAHQGSCCPGGFYFTDATNILNYINFGCHLRVVELPLTHPKFKCVADDGKWRANMIILKDRLCLDQPSTFEYLFSCHSVNYSNGLLTWAAKNGYTDVVRYFFYKMSGKSNLV